MIKMWKSLFQDHILFRGIDYYERNLVKDVNNEDGQITGTVIGTKDYSVEILKEKDEIVNMFCSCPHATSGNNCKHMVAVLFYLENNDPHFSKKTKEDDVEELVEGVDVEVLKDFVIDLLSHDAQLLNRFKSIIKDEILPTDIVFYKNQINDIFWEYGGYQDFVDYEDSFDFTTELESILNNEIQNIVTLKEWSAAFELTEYLFIQLGNQFIDDSGGNTWGVIHDCIEIWEQILNQCDINIKRKMYNSFLKIIDGEIIQSQDYFIEYIEQFIFDHFKEKEFQLEKIDRLDIQIKSWKEEANSNRGDYELNKYCLRKVKILEELNTDQKKIADYCMEHIYLDDIRKYYIDVCIKNKNYNQAIILLKEGKKQQEVNHVNLLYYSTQLKDLYKFLDMDKLYKEELWQLLVKYDKGNIDVFRELKSLYSENDWLHKRNLIFTELVDAVTIDELYREEKLYDLLIEVVMNSEELYMVRKHEDILKNLYPEKLLTKYEQAVAGMATQALGRKYYRKIIAILSEMRKYPGGSIKISEIVLDWREKYANRPAMMDELDKV